MYKSIIICLLNQPVSIKTIKTKAADDLNHYIYSCIYSKNYELSLEQTYLDRPINIFLGSRFIRIISLRNSILLIDS